MFFKLDIHSVDDTVPEYELEELEFWNSLPRDWYTISERSRYLVEKYRLLGRIEEEKERDYS